MAINGECHGDERISRRQMNFMAKSEFRGDYAALIHSFETAPSRFAQSA